MVTRIKLVKLEQTGSLFAAKTAVAKVELGYGGWKLFSNLLFIGEKHEVFNTQYS